MAEPLIVRDYQSGADYHLLCGWWQAHHWPAVPETLFPPDAYIVEGLEGPLAFCVFYLSLNIGVAWLDWMVSAPGLRPQQTRKAFQRLLAEFGQRHGSAYGLLRGMCRDGVQREAARAGFTVAAQPSYEMMKEVRI